MGIYLFLIKTDFWTYNKYSENSSEIKSYKFKSTDEALKLGNFFLDEGINEYCDSLIAPYDTDFLNKDQCIILKKWISDHKQIIKNSNLEEVFKILDEYCEEAIILNTGIEIEL